MIIGPVTTLKREGKHTISQISQKRIQNVSCPSQSLAIKSAETNELAYRYSSINEEADLQINLCTRGVPLRLFFHKVLICWCCVWLSVLTRKRKRKLRGKNVLLSSQFAVKFNPSNYAVVLMPQRVSHCCAFLSHCSAISSWFLWSREVILPLWFWSCCRHSTSSLSCQGASCIPPPPGKAPSHTTTSQLLWMLQATKTREMVMQVTFTLTDCESR